MAHIQSHREVGFTLIGLLITVVILAIVAGIAVPGFSTLLSDSRSRALTNDLVLALNLGRSEALKRGQSITVCAYEGCGTSVNWSQGWQFLGPEGRLLREWSLASRTASVAAGRPEVEFNAMGRVAEPLAVSLEVRGVRSLVEVQRSGLVRSVSAGESSS